MSGASLFRTVPQEDYLSLFHADGTDYRKVVDLLGMKKKEVAMAANVPRESVRFDKKIPAELAERLTEWAVALAIVARYFKDAQKTVLWFKVRNPLLGDITPRDMIRIGRFNKLRRFILNALSEGGPVEE